MLSIDTGARGFLLELARRKPSAQGGFCMIVYTIMMPVGLLAHPLRPCESLSQPTLP